MTRFAGAQGFMGPFSCDGGASIAPYPPWHYAADFTTIECWVDPATIEALLPPYLSLHPDERGLVTVSFVDWQACTDTGGELLDPVRSQYRECIVLASVQYEGKLMQYCPYIVVDQDTSLARGLALGYPKKIGSVWVTRTMGVTSVASPAVAHGSTFAGTVAVKDRRIAEGHVTLDSRADGSAVTFGSCPIVGLRHFPSMLEAQQDRPAVFELVRLQAENVLAGPVWEGSAELTVYDSPTEVLSTLRPAKIGRGWRYSMAITNRNISLLRDLRDVGEQAPSEEN